MEFKQLEMLSVVVEEGTYQRAGKRLNISHSAIHRQIRLLEGELSTRILVRRGKGVTLTESGKIMVDLAQRLRHDIVATSQQIRDLSQLRSGRIRIGTGTTMLKYFLPGVIEQFRSRFPGVTLQLMTGTADEVLSEIERDRLDTGIIFLPHDAVDRKPLVKYERLYQEEFVVATGKFRRSRGRSISLEELGQLPFITYSRTSYVRRSIERLFVSVGLQPRIDMELENEEAIQRMLALGVGVAIVTKRSAENEKLPFVKIQGHSISHDVVLVSKAWEGTSRALTEFSAICRTVARGF